MFIFREACESLPGAAPGRSCGSRVVGVTREASETLSGATAGRSRSCRVVGFAREASETLPGAAPGRSRGSRVVGFTREASETLPGAAAGRSRGARVVGFAREASESTSSSSSSLPVATACGSSRGERVDRFRSLSVSVTTLSYRSPGCWEPEASWRPCASTLAGLLLFAAMDNSLSSFFSFPAPLKEDNFTGKRFFSSSVLRGESLPIFADFFTVC